MNNKLLLISIFILVAIISAVWQVLLLNNVNTPALILFVVGFLFLPFLAGYKLNINQAVIYVILLTVTFIVIDTLIVNVHIDWLLAYGDNATKFMTTGLIYTGDLSYPYPSPRNSVVMFFVFLIATTAGNIVSRKRKNIEKV
ncbi:MULTISPECIES: hypothetical protein [Methanobacterium]|uniref:Uncharacterized protein n=1 Tax=Methanobacterium formicicum TaxID=2162 RepID=A0A843AGA9_METFO|nr:MULTISPECIES: hypothetical protein [Methanobacterium]KUK72759.1 MAG: hypothetical protein XD90_1758 [Methanobacterium sp. 42_16]MBF4474187.1 hypothetical protein [Methanobacterium formicicum]